MNTPKTLFELLNPKQRSAALALMTLMLFGALLETLGVGLVMPVLTLMTEENLAVQFPFLGPWLTRLGNPDHQRLVQFGMLALVLVYAVKSAFLAALTWWQGRFVFGLQADLSQRLFAGYLRQPYVFHLERNSAVLIRNVIGQVGDLTYVLQQMMVLVTEGLLLIGISALLLAVEPIGALLVVSTIGLAGWGFNHLARKHILRWGEARQHHEALRLQHLQEGLGGAKDVKLLGRERDFLEQYRRHSVGSARVSQRQATLQALPRLWLELLAIIGLAILVMVMLWRGKALAALLPTLGVFAAAAFRLMPSVTRILGAHQGMRFYLPAIHSLREEFRLLDATVPPSSAVRPLPFKHELTLHHVSYRYPSTEAPALRAIELSIPRGGSAGFIGGSGAGKSTLVDVILGLLTPEAGTVQVDGVDIQTDLRAWQDQIGYVSQSIYLTDDTLRRNVAFGLASEEIDEAAVWKAMRAAQLESFVNELPKGLDTMVGERGVRLSGGQRQRIGIARALYHDPSVLVLDEATSSLDPATERDVMDAVGALQGDKTLIIVAHRFSTVERCDRLFCLKDGALAAQPISAT